MLIAEFARLWFSWFLFGVLFGCLAGVLVNALCLWFEVVFCFVVWLIVALYLGGLLVVIWCFVLGLSVFCACWLICRDCLCDFFVDCVLSLNWLAGVGSDLRILRFLVVWLSAAF